MLYHGIGGGANAPGAGGSSFASANVHAVFESRTLGASDGLFFILDHTGKGSDEASIMAISHTVDPSHLMHKGKRAKKHGAKMLR